MAGGGGGRVGAIARGSESHGAPDKKFALFRFRANALPSWASFLFPNRIGISTKKTEKWPVFAETLSSTTGRIHYAQGITRYRSWPHCYAGLIRARG